MNDERHPEHDQLHRRLDDLMKEIRAAKNEASGAHRQARATNGRVDGLESVVWGDPSSLNQHDAGLVGVARQIRRDLRIIGAFLTVTLVPIALTLLNGWIRTVT